MDNRPYKELTGLLFLLCFGTTLSASIFGFNLGSLKDAAINKIEQVPKFLNRVNLLDHRKQQSETKIPTTFQDNHENIRNEPSPYTNTLNPAKYTDRQNWGMNDPVSSSNNQGNTVYNGYMTTFSPLPSKYNSQRQEWDSDGPISFGDNAWSNNGFKNFINPTTNKIQQESLFTPVSPHFINKVGPEQNVNYASGQVNVNSRGSFHDGVGNSKPLLPENYKKNSPADEYLSEHAHEFSTEYSSTTDNEWTTTDEPLNRIGAPPAVVASILG